jgi:hypothetical protein
MERIEAGEPGGGRTGRNGWHRDVWGAAVLRPYKDARLIGIRVIYKHANALAK